MAGYARSKRMNVEQDVRQLWHERNPHCAGVRGRALYFALFQAWAWLLLIQCGGGGIPMDIVTYGIYPHRDSFEAALEALRAAGFRNSDISAILPERDR